MEVIDLPLSQELDHIIHIRVITEPKNIIIGYPCLLLWYDYKCTTDPENP